MPTDSVFSSQLMRRDYWERLLPELSICETLNETSVAPFVIGEGTLQSLEQQMLIEGYFQHQESGQKPVAHLLANAVRKLVGLGLPPVFLFLFDESWACFYRLNAILSRILKGEYLLLPDFWAWYINPIVEESGWIPHRDKGKMSLAEDGSPLSATVWIPLSTAIPLNGCMSLVPADRDPTYGKSNEYDFEPEFANIRALPAAPGDILCWNQAVLHWGGKASKRASEPRISMACEFQRAGIAPFNLPLIAPFTNLTFSQRQCLVGKQILQYQHMYPLSEELGALAVAMTLLPWQN